jgi:hypothetical protein
MIWILIIIFVSLVTIYMIYNKSNMKWIMVYMIILTLALIGLVVMFSIIPKIIKYQGEAVCF